MQKTTEAQELEIRFPLSKQDLLFPWGMGPTETLPVYSHSPKGPKSQHKFWKSTSIKILFLNSLILDRSDGMGLWAFPLQQSWQGQEMPRQAASGQL